MVKMVFENGTEVASGKGSAFFTLKTDSKDDFGRLNCSAVNSNGKAEVSLELKILGMYPAVHVDCFWTDKGLSS